MHIVVHSSLAEIKAVQWNRLISDNNPFIRYEFLHGLEETACVCVQTGWQPFHFAAYDDENCGTLIAAMPCYIKQHSYGEYIFDWSWADAHNRHGLDYYPKLSNAVPFTPATGQRILVQNESSREEATQLIIKAAMAALTKHNLSSFHSLFLNESEATQLSAMGLSIRHSTQFHWHNKAYTSFEDFLAQLSSKKRKNIKRERRRIVDSGISYRWLSGEQLNSSAVETMVKFYQRTIRYYGGQAYLKPSFFHYLANNFSQQTLFLFAEHEGHVIAGGLYFKSDTTLYGRYWGALDNFHSVHFETCYYQAIEWCIKHGYQSFEAGAQGEHKLARGLEPTTTYSSHWIQHKQFREAIDDFLTQEEQQIGQYQQRLQSHSAFKQIDLEQNTNKMNHE